MVTPQCVSHRNTGSWWSVSCSVLARSRSASQADPWRYRDDKITDYLLRSRRRADAGSVGLHQSLRSRAAFCWWRSDRRRQWGCNRGCRCRRPRCGARRRGRWSCRGGHRPYHNATPARLSRLLQSPALRLLQSSTLRELQRAKTTPRGEHRDDGLGKPALGLLSGRRRFCGWGRAPLTSRGSEALNTYTYAQAWRANTAVICLAPMSIESYESGLWLRLAR